VRPPRWRGMTAPGGTVRAWIASPLRWHFLAVAAVSLSLGVALFAVPGLGPSLWPYRIKDLAVRFFASVFLALAVASVVALRVPERRAREVLLVMGASVFGFIALAAVADPAALVASSGAVLWFALLTAFALGSLLFLLRRPAATEPDAGPPMPRFLRYHFLLHTGVVLLFSLQFLLIPRFAAENGWPWRVSDPVMRGIGGLFTGVAMSLKKPDPRPIPAAIEFNRLLRAQIGQINAEIARENEERRRKTTMIVVPAEDGS